MQEGLPDEMRKRSDAELYAMLHHNRDDWTPEALIAAEQEFSSRNLSQARIAEVHASCESEARRQEALANEPLSLLVKVVFFLLNPLTCVGLFVLVPIAEIAFRNRGYERTYREAWEYMGFGVVVTIILVASRLFAVAMH